MFYTTVEVAEILRLHPRTIKRLAELGEIPKPLLIGKNYRWPKSVIDDFINPHRTRLR